MAAWPNDDVRDTVKHAVTELENLMASMPMTMKEPRVRVKSKLNSRLFDTIEERLVYL